MPKTKKKRALRLLSGVVAVVWFIAAFPVAVLAAGRFGVARSGALRRTELYNNLTAARVIGLQGALVRELEARDVPQFAIRLLALTPEKVAQAMPEYPKAAKALASLGGSWEGYAPETIALGITDGDKEAFFRACAAGLRPMTALLALVGDLTDEPGRSGQYETAILPLLEALDCPDVISAASLSYRYRRAQAGKNQHDYLADALLRPLFGLAEDIMTDPLRRLPEILPNLAWQMEQGALDSLFRLKLRLLKLEIKVFPCKDVEELLALLETAAGVHLPEIDWAKLAQAGTLSRRKTLRTGMEDAPYLKADRLRASALLAGWAWRFCRAEQNRGSLRGWLEPIAKYLYLPDRP